MYRTLGLATLLPLLATPSFAAETFSISGDAGATARYIDSRVLADPDGYGISLGLRTEVNFLFHLKGDVRYVDGRMFSNNEDRYVDVSLSGSSPALLVFAFDVHEVMFRSTTRPGDDQFYLATGLAVKGRVLGNSLKASVGFAYLSADGIADTNKRALGAYVGAEHRFRSNIIDTNVRAAWFIAMDQGEPHQGILADGDLTLKFPVGKVFLGPRLDVTYRNLGIDGNAGPLFGQKHEFDASLGFAVHWGTAGKKK